jgi:hypothetical protein
MKTPQALLVVACVAAILVACESPRDATSACPLSPTARDLVTQQASELFQAGASSTTGTHDGGFVDVAFQMDLPALDVGVVQSASLVVPCSEPATFVPSCESTLNPAPPTDPFFNEHDRCFRLGCVDADKPHVDAYFTMKPATNADARHAFTASTTSPSGTSTYDPNPLIRWVADLTTDGAVDITASFDMHHTFTTTDETLDASLTGTFAGTSRADSDGDVVTLDLSLVFPALAEGGDMVLTARADEKGHVTGGVVQGGVTLATLDDDGNLGTPLPFLWQDACE